MIAIPPAEPIEPTVATLRSYSPFLPDEIVDWQALKAEFDAPAHPVLGAILADPVGASAAGVTQETASAFLAELALRLSLAHRFAPESQMLTAAFRSALMIASAQLAGQPMAESDMIDLCWAICQSPFNPYGSTIGLDRLFERALGSDTLLARPAVRNALLAVVHRAERLRLADCQYAIAELIIGRLGIERSVSAVLKAKDADFAARTERRTTALRMAGSLLAPAIELSLDMGAWNLEHRQAISPMKEMLSAGPTVLGLALVSLADIEEVCLRPPYSRWDQLAGGPANYPVNRTVSDHRGMEPLRSLILAQAVEIPDAAMARLVRGLPRSRVYSSTGSHVFDNAYLSPQFLALMLAAADRPDGAETRQALAELVDAGRAFSLPDGWRAAIMPVIGRTAPGGNSLSLPDIGVGFHFDAQKRMCAHYANLLDIRLHDLAHARDLEALIFADGSIPPPPAFDLEASDNLTFQERLQQWFLVTRNRNLAASATAITSELAAVRPFLTEGNAPQLASLGSHCVGLNGKASPSGKWLQTARRLAESCQANILPALLEALIGTGFPDPPGQPAGIDLLRGLIFLSADWQAARTGPLLVEFALRNCFQTVPGHGIRAEKIGNACLWALIHMPKGAGVPYLARMLARTSYPKVRKRIDEALEAAAAAAGLSRGAFDELLVPAHSLDKEGRALLPVGDGEALVAINGVRTASISWEAAGGRKVKSPTATMKADKSGLAAARTLAKEIERDLGTQVLRLQRLYLESREWTFADWQDRYVCHPLLRRLVQGLVWQLHRNGALTEVLPCGDLLFDIAGRPVDGSGGCIKLWHPLHSKPETVARWRKRLEELEIVQPFSQAWREVYRPTDAERRSGNYSNRWAGHILKQHQFNALARLNGWTVTPRIWADAPKEPSDYLVIDAHGLVADFWVEGAGGENPEVLDSQAYVFVSTDTLSFRPLIGPAVTGARGPERGEPVRIEAVPAIVFSEVMRHCDLFTSVASIAADPNWRDRGHAAPIGRWQAEALDYWGSFSFAELTESARVRRAMLERIIPRLAIADQCELDDRALCIRGKLHSYRIHIGSAAVKIMPENRHVCIVANVISYPVPTVPYDGDHILSLVLSKALLLAADDRITDPVILQQLQRA